VSFVCRTGEPSGRRAVVANLALQRSGPATTFFGIIKGTFGGPVR
jgi:hypothetical protein